MRPRVGIASFRNPKYLVQLIQNEGSILASAADPAVLAKAVAQGWARVDRVGREDGQRGAEDRAFAIMATESEWDPDAAKLRKGAV
jgi:hypothetical protein